MFTSFTLIIDNTKELLDSIMNECQEIVSSFPIDEWDDWYNARDEAVKQLTPVVRAWVLKNRVNILLELSGDIESRRELNKMLREAKEEDFTSLAKHYAQKKFELIYYSNK